MNVSLVSPPTTVFDRYPKDHPLRRGFQVTEPLGLGYLASNIQDLSGVKIVDCIAENLSSDECVSRVKESDLIGISVVDNNAEISKRLAQKIKEVNPNAIIVFGGIHPSLYPDEVLSNKDVDIVVIGEGEHTLREIVSNVPLEKVSGIVFRKDGKLVKTEPRPLERNLDIFHFPARYLIPMEKYHPFLYLKNPVHSLISSRGCPFTCIYCCRDISGQTYRVRSVEKVIEEIKYLVSGRAWRSREIDFQDPLFGLNEKWLRAFCNAMIREKIDVVWSALTRVNVVNEDLLRLMKRAGCWMLYYGIEAGTQHLLDNIKKRTTLDMVKKSVELTSRVGIKTWGSFMFALPGETPESASETLRFAKSLPLDFASFHLTTPFKGTELEKEHWKWGRMNSDLLEDFTQLNPVFIPFGWEGKEEQLKQFFIKAFRGFYLRPRYILRQLSKTRSFDEVKMYFRGLKVVI